MLLRVVPLLLASLLVLAGPMAAHLSWPTYHSARSAVSLGEQGLEVVVVLEVPTFRLVADFKEHFSELDLMAEIEAGRFETLENQFRDVRFVDFAATLGLELDGVPAVGSWEPVDTPVNGKGTEGFFVYMFEFVFEQPPVPDARTTVRVLNQAFAGEEVVMANQAKAGEGWQIEESSIPQPEAFDLPAGAELEDPELGLWTIDPVKRDLRVTFAKVGDAARPLE